MSSAYTDYTYIDKKKNNNKDLINIFQTNNILT